MTREEFIQEFENAEKEDSILIECAEIPWKASAVKDRYIEFLEIENAKLKASLNNISEIIKEYKKRNGN